MIKRLTSACALAALLACPQSWAALAKPVLTPAQQQAAADKKAADDAKAARDKENLAASMDAVAARWRAQAPAKGWKIQPPVQVAAAAPAAGRAPNMVLGTQGTAAGGTQAAAGGTAPGAARAAAAAGAVPAGVTPPAAGMPAAPPANAAPGTAAAAPATGAAPLSRQALNAANVPVKSEKHGTAAPSEDVKRGPTRAVPKGVGPAVEKSSTPKTANKQ
ncbi:hypothetical protein LQ564_19620 [Massilia sp. G4R7]|uniref:Meckel syndrome type 1 protein n=2 Tax=Massilia TaxID=149698 RepID=A0ABS8Q9T2_9BURK|nr:hypothetical protein [Massilia phyllostachyos]MCD2518516.1 hypothetical protein [Massilia phyllostachyos]